MKLKASGKAILIALVVGIVAVAINYSNLLEKKPESIAVDTEQIESVTPPVQVKQETPNDETAEPVPTNDVSMNRGLSAVINQGKKQ